MHSSISGLCLIYPNTGNLTAKMANSEHIGLFIQKNLKEYCPICFLFVTLYLYLAYKYKNIRIVNATCGRTDPIRYEFAIFGHLKTGLGIIPCLA